MITDRLYYTDCYRVRFEARVVERARDGRRVYLDRTAFYPTSGGQPHDVGVLGAMPVIDVIDEGERIAHVTDAPIDQNSVECEIDWMRRYDHMQQHTGQHLLSAALVELFDFQTVSFHMGAEVSTIELTTPELTESQMERAEERTNGIVREARPVHIRFEQQEAARNLRKPSERGGSLRVIEIEGYDRSACGGTHVRSTAEVAPVQMRKVERMRGNTRIEFVCGIRALRRAKNDFRIAAEAASIAGVSIDKLREHVKSLHERLAASERERQQLSVEIGRLEADALYETTEPGLDGLRRILLQVQAIDYAVRAKAQAITKRERVIALVIGAEPASVIVAVSADSDVNAGGLLKQVLSGFGARGGGSATFAQGNLPGESTISELKRALGF